MLCWQDGGWSSAPLTLRTASRCPPPSGPLGLRCPPTLRPSCASSSRLEGGLGSQGPSQQGPTAARTLLGLGIGSLVRLRGGGWSKNARKTKSPVSGTCTKRRRSRSCGHMYGLAAANHQGTFRKNENTSPHEPTIPATLFWAWHSLARDPSYAEAAPGRLTVIVEKGQPHGPSELCPLCPQCLGVLFRDGCPDTYRGAPGVCA